MSPGGAFVRTASGAGSRMARPAGAEEAPVPRTAPLARVPHKPRVAKALAEIPFVGVASDF